ncbi:hypothetical protein [Nonomuraea bangladeshensis]
MRHTLRLAEEWDGGLLACFEVGGEVLMVTLEAVISSVSSDIVCW